MNLRDLVRRNRSYRRFFQEEKIERETLEALVDLARLSPSAANLQPLKFHLSSDPEANELIFEHLAWAAYLRDWSGPSSGERPSAYIVILGDKTICESFGCDHGIAAQSILLGATEMGLGGCIIASVSRKGLADALGLGQEQEILLVVALGKPKETVEIEAPRPDGSIEYWRDAAGVHHVPKRLLVDIIIK